MIRMKGDIIKQLNFIYPEYSFKNRYKEDFKNRIKIFFDQILNEKTLSEILELSKKYCIIENNEIKLLNNLFVETYKIELLNSFNPLWFYNRKEIKKEEKIEESIDLSHYLLKEILDTYIFNKIGSEQIKKSIKYFNENLYFTGEEILINRQVEIFKKIYHERINYKEYTEQTKTFKEMKEIHKNYNVKNIGSLLLNLSKYLNMLLKHNPYFNIYVSKESNFSLFPKYKKIDRLDMDYCLTYVPLKEEFIFLKSKSSIGSSFFKLLKNIKEEDIFEEASFKSLKEEIQEKMIIANEYKKIKNFIVNLSNYFEENKNFNIFYIEEIIKGFDYDIKE